jgi:hypothetical protein
MEQKKMSLEEWIEMIRNVVPKHEAEDHTEAYANDW